MTTAADILTTARSRANEGTPYAGAVTPQEAYDLLQGDAAAKLIDVRTNAERDWVGRVDIADTQHGAVQWATYPGGVPNPDFLAQLAAQAGRLEVSLGALRKGARIAVIRLAVAGLVHVARQENRGFFKKWVDVGRIGIRHQQHVGSFNAFPASDGRTVKGVARLEFVHVEVRPGTVTCCSLPRVSAKQKSTNLTSFSSTIFKTSAAVIAMRIS